MEEPLVWEGGSRECCPPPCLFTLWQVHLRGALWLRDMRRNSSVNTSDIWHINKLGNTPAQAAQVNSDLLSPGVKSAALEMEKSAKCLWKGRWNCGSWSWSRASGFTPLPYWFWENPGCVRWISPQLSFFLLFFPYFFPTI